MRQSNRITLDIIFYATTAGCQTPRQWTGYLQEVDGEINLEQNVYHSIKVQDCSKSDRSYTLGKDARP
ncbi:hypothetical protein Hypma_003920 [Hypsizygus marmoreus]|uniref:Uncharacterized protein n=1 Tax=Hypsizygus marmoreus TaxID=39966 RepID=A0A369J130_HYPMA|nr:hypothetical protein Hypma_003920 [Hypsizygus marmoreus]